MFSSILYRFQSPPYHLVENLLSQAGQKKMCCLNSSGFGAGSHFVQQKVVEPMISLFNFHKIAGMHRQFCSQNLYTARQLSSTELINN